MVSQNTTYRIPTPQYLQYQIIFISVKKCGITLSFPFSLIFVYLTEAAFASLCKKVGVNVVPASIRVFTHVYFSISYVHQLSRTWLHTLDNHLLIFTLTHIHNLTYIHIYIYKKKHIGHMGISFQCISN